MLSGNRFTIHKTLYMYIVNISLLKLFYLRVLILKVLILIHCFRGQILLLWACLKTDVRVCKKCKGRHANRYLNQKQGREISAKKRHRKKSLCQFIDILKKKKKNTFFNRNVRKSRVIFL